MNLRIVLSSLALALSMSACDASFVDEAPDAGVDDGIGTSPSEPVDSEDFALSRVCTATYQCGTINAPRECCRCWEIVPCPAGLEWCSYCSF